MNNIIISGFGGQGVLSLGQFLAHSALDMELCTSWLPSYGPEMRGGTANCSVAISENEIASPLISKPNFLVALNDPSVDKFLPKLAFGGTLLVHSDIVKRKIEREDINVYYVPVDSLVKDINPRGGNIIMFGVIVALLGNIAIKSAENAVRKVFYNKPNLIDVSIETLHRGIDFVKGYKVCNS